MAPRLLIPETQTELQEMLDDEHQLSNIMSDPKTFKNFMRNYVNAFGQKNGDVSVQVQEQAEQVAMNYLRENGELANASRLNLDPYAPRVRRHTVYNKDARGAQYDKYFGNTTKFLHAISEHSHVDAELSKKLGTLKNDLSSIKPSDGGYLIPEILRAELLQTALESAIVRSRAFVVPMDSLTVDFPCVDSTSNVSSVFGGVTGYWTEEGATLTESQPRFARVKLQAHKLTLYTEVPNELIRDAQPSMTALIEGMFPQALAWFEDVAFFLGGGVGEPLGFLNAPAAVSPTRSTGVAGTNVEWVDIAAMYARMLPQSLSRAVWIVSPDVLPSLLTMTVASGSNAVWMGGGNFASGAATPPMSMLGAPIIVSEKARAVGTSGDINFVDLGMYLVGDRQAMSARQSEDFKFNQDVTAFRIIERVDGRPWLLSAITPQNGGATLSPFVKLTTSV